MNTIISFAASRSLDLVLLLLARTSPDRPLGRTYSYRIY